MITITTYMMNMDILVLQHTKMTLMMIVVEIVIVIVVVAVI